MSRGNHLGTDNKRNLENHQVVQLRVSIHVRSFKAILLYFGLSLSIISRDDGLVTAGDDTKHVRVSSIPRQMCGCPSLSVLEEWVAWGGGGE